jgi:hypothetical protein
MRTLSAGLAAALLLWLPAGCDFGLTGEEATAVETGALSTGRLRRAGPVHPPDPSTVSSDESTVRAQAPEVPVQAMGRGALHHQQTPASYPGIGTPMPPGDEP